MATKFHYKPTAGAQQTNKTIETYHVALVTKFPVQLKAQNRE